MRCLVLAGGVPRPGDALFEETRGRAKALIEIAGRPMVQWVLDALAASGRVDSVVLVGLPLETPLVFHGEIVRVASQGSLAQNLYAGVDRLLDLEPDLVRAAYCWSDIPLVTGPAIRRFVDCAGEEAPGADVVAGLVRREALEARYPSLSERWLKTREGAFVAADFGLFNPTRAETVRGPLETLTDRRKSAMRQASSVGPGLLITYLLGRLTLPGLERTLERRYRIRSKVLIAEDPELGLDVDGRENLAICRRELELAHGRDAAGPQGT